MKAQVVKRCGLDVVNGGKQNDPEYEKNGDVMRNPRSTVQKNLLGRKDKEVFEVGRLQC